MADNDQKDCKQMKDSKQLKAFEEEQRVRWVNVNNWLRQQAVRMEIVLFGERIVT